MAIPWTWINPWPYLGPTSTRLRYLGPVSTLWPYLGLGSTRLRYVGPGSTRNKETVYFYSVLFLLTVYSVLFLFVGHTSVPDQPSGHILVPDRPGSHISAGYRFRGHCLLINTFAPIGQFITTAQA